MTARGIRAAALAAALVGLGLVFHRPRIVPALRPIESGKNRPERPSPNGTPPSETTARKTALWPSTKVSGSPLAPSSWRDAPTDYPALNGGLSGWAAAGRTPGTAKIPVIQNKSKLPSAKTLVAKPAHASIAGSKLAPVNVYGAVSANPAPAHHGRPGRDLYKNAVSLHSPFFKNSSLGRARPGNRINRASPKKSLERARAKRNKNVVKNAGAMFRRKHPIFPLFWPPRRSIRETKPSKIRRVRPPLLARLLGRNPWRPPPSSLSAPDPSKWPVRRPKTQPDGSPVPSRSFTLEDLEATPWDRTRTAPCRQRSPHWHPGLSWHDGATRGLIKEDRWLWLWRDAARWWAAPNGELPPFLMHRGLWWCKQLDVWFALHQGELWSWRRFSQWDAEGLLHLVNGVSIIYSADFSRVAVLVPGDGAVLYDAATGAELGRWREDELPHRRPKPPENLRLPPGI